MESVEWHNARAHLIWQLELGATECIGDVPIDRYAVPDRIAPPKEVARAETGLAPVAAPEIRPAAEVAQKAKNLAELRTALEQLGEVDLKRGARSFVAGEGPMAADIMVIGGIPDRDEDKSGRAFSAANGVLFDAMFAAIGHHRSREGATIFATTAIPWRTPQDRMITSQEADALRPFLVRQIALVKPKLVVAMGNVATKLLLDESRASKLRGQWHMVEGLPVMVMQHPRSLRGKPSEKREAWADLLAIKARLLKENQT